MTQSSGRGDAGIWTSEDGAAAVLERYEQHLAAWPVPVRRHTLDTTHGSTFALTCGDDEAPAVVLLHGTGANSSVWRDGIAELAAEHRVVMVDLLGEPGFSSPVRIDLATPDTADWLVQTLDGLGVGSAAVAGLSLGGWTAADLASRHPDRVQRLALLSPAGIGRQTIWKVAPAFFLSFLGARGRRRSAEIVTGLDGREHPGVLEEIDLVFQHFRPRTERYPVLGDDALRRLTMPVLAVVGARERVFDPVQTQRRLTALLPDVRVDVLPDAGHALLGQVPRIAEFLA
ncbi:alpha/beta fold hydrolase [Aeromicrobium sp. CF4.19]|uniref:alpha/beta fold hydrolase n=1 Tax=Aeromicrobium sp. CF4.19 TaxID=3373082 RepID=UPI003EE55E83